MVKRWNQFNESNNLNMIQKKILLLTDLSTDLTDLGLEVEIWSGTKLYGEDANKYIIMLIDDDKHAILDKDGYYRNKLIDKKEIIEFLEKAESYGFISSAIEDENNSRTYIYFLKTGKTTKTPLLY